MATLTGKTIANTYKDLLQVSNNNGGVDGTLRTVSDGEGTNSPLQLSNSAVNINGTFQLNGNTLTATASALNAITDLSGVTGFPAISGGTAVGRTLIAGTGVSVANGDGLASNPVISLDSTGVVSASYGPHILLEVNSRGQIVSAATPVSVSVSNFTATKLASTNNLVGVSATFTDKVSAATFYGDGSNLTNLPTAPVSVSAYTVNVLTVVSAATVNGIISATNFVGGGAGLANVSAVFAASATNATNAVNATSAVFASSATNATNAVSASFATSATDATNATNAVSAVFATSATNATNAVNATNATSAVFAASATNATNAVNATNATSAVFASSATNATNAVNATSAVFATSATNATNAVNATNATSAVFAASATNATNAVNATNATSAVFASSATNATNAVNATSAVFASSATNATNAVSAVFATSATNATTAVNVSGGSVLATTGSFSGAVSTSTIFSKGIVISATDLLGKKLRVAGPAISDIVSLTDGTSIAVDFNTAQNFAVMLTGSRTLENPANCVAGQTGSIFVMQNVSGGKTLSFGSNWKFATGTAPTLTTTASAVDRIDYIVFTSTAIHTVATLDVR